MLNENAPAEHRPNPHVASGSQIRHTNSSSGECDNPAPDIERLRIRQAELECTIRELQDALTEACDLHKANLERINMRISDVQVRAARAYQASQSILQSRAWRTLVWGGGLLLSATSWLNRLRRSFRRTPGSAIEAHIQRDAPATAGPFSGELHVRGWAIARAGVAEVQVEIRGVTGPVHARYGLYRPDVRKMFSSVPSPEYSGFFAKIDTLAIPDGEHELIIRARDMNGRVFEIESDIHIDHANGYGGEYARFISETESLTPVLIRSRIARFMLKPLISVIVPVYKTETDILARTVDSVRRQTYDNWELCIVDDCSRSPAIDALLSAAASADPRINLISLQTNIGISGASNEALRIASGEYVALLDHDDELAPNALFHVVEALNQEPLSDILYSDEDHIDREGNRSTPFLKPDWSPDLLLAENYVCHLMVFRRDLALTVGGFRTEVDLSQDHDILLRMCRHTDRIVHIPKILYHWRTEVDPADINRASFREREAFASSRRVIEDHIRDSKLSATVEEGRHPGRWRVRYALPADPPHVSIIIPSGGKLEVLERNLKAMAATAHYPNWDVLVIDNSKGRSIESYVQKCGYVGRPVRYMDHRNQPFNFSVICNKAARHCSSPILLFLNDDIEAIEEGWLTAMVEQVIRPEVGAVGARLLYPDGRIQHAGVTMGLFGICGHSFKGLFADQRIYFDFPDVVRNVSAVTAACMMTRADVFWEVGGFDEVRFPVAYNDVDLCLKIGEKGYRIIYTPHASLYHYEAFSKTVKDLDPRPGETRALIDKWSRVIRRDPFYNPNLTTTAEDFSLKVSARGRDLDAAVVR